MTELALRHRDLLLASLFGGGLYLLGRLAYHYLLRGPHRLASLRLEGKTVLITGASMGLGRELAFEFHRRGARLILTARSIDKLKTLVDELKAAHPANQHEPEFCYLDVAEPNGGLDEVRKRCSSSGLHVIVHNAGLSMRGSIANTPIEILRQVMEVNFFGPALLTRELLPLMPADGSLLVISSMQGLIAVPYRSAYTASKHALQGWFDSLRSEDRSDIHILTVSAGYMRTGFGTRALDEKGEPVNRADADQDKGLDPTYCARAIVGALIKRQTEIVLAPSLHGWAITLRRWLPRLYFHAMHKRALKEVTLHAKNQ